MAGPRSSEELGAVPLLIFQGDKKLYRPEVCSIPLPFNKIDPSATSITLTIPSVAYAELIIILAYVFRRFKITTPAGYTPPAREDRFAIAYLDPGLLVKFELRE